MPDFPHVLTQVAELFLVIAGDAFDNRPLELVHVLQHPEAQHHHIEHGQDAGGEAAEKGERVARRDHETLQDVPALLDHIPERERIGADGHIRSAEQGLQRLHQVGDRVLGGCDQASAAGNENGRGDNGDGQDQDINDRHREAPPPTGALLDPVDRISQHKGE